MASSRPVRALLLAVVALLAVALPACSSDGGGGDAAPETVDLDGATTADFDVVGNVQAVTVTGAEPGAELQLVNPDGEVQTALFSPDGLSDAKGTVDDEGTSCSPASTLGRATGSSRRPTTRLRPASP